MKIRTLGNLLAITSIIILLLSLFALYLTKAQISRQNSDSVAIRELVSNTRNLHNIVIQTALYHESRSQSLWQPQRDKLRHALNNHIYTSSNENATAQAIRDNIKILDVLYQRLLDISLARRETSKALDTGDELTARTLSSLLLTKQEMLDSTNELGEFNREETSIAERRHELLTLGLALIMSISILTVWYLLKKSILLPITLLQHGTEIVRKGNLGYRINLQNNNEIGDLARNFDAMTSQLERSLCILQEEILERQKTQNSLAQQASKLEQELAERKQAEENKEAGDRLLTRILQTLPVAVFCKNIRNNFEFSVWNKKAEEIFGLTAAECLGKTDYDFFTKENADWFREMDLVACRSENVIDIPEEVVQSKNKTLIVHTQKTVILDSRGNPHYLLCVSEDITQRTQVDRMKSEFISTVSHELRTPLTSIRGSLALLEAGVCGNISPKAMMLVNVAHRNSQRLIGLVNDILDMEKLASDGLLLQLQPVDLVQLVHHGIEANSGYAETFHVRYLFTSHPEQVWVSADADRLMQVLTNLLSNAAKFSPAHTQVEMRLQLENNVCKLEIADQGPGIPATFHNRIFGKFAQADGSNTRQQGGTGLGLHISKSLIEKMNGQIGFIPAPEKGTIFWFTLPLVAPVDGIIPMTIIQQTT